MISSVGIQEVSVLMFCKERGEQSGRVHYRPWNYWKVIPRRAIVDKIYADEIEHHDNPQKRPTVTLTTSQSFPTPEEE